MQNYFNYFTEIEEHFQRRRGSILLLSTLDWALIETWREAGIPLEAVLRGIDEAFDKCEARKAHARMRPINGLAWCTQAVMEAVEAMKEASIGAQPVAASSAPAPGFEPESIAAHLNQCANQLDQAPLTGLAADVALQTSARLRELAVTPPSNLEELERNLSVLEEKLFTTLVATASEADLLTLRDESARELARYRSRMKTEQIRQVEQQFLRKRMLEKYALPRLSLFYMSRQ
ncbi:MAG TPA: hypothetical protein VME86_03955 [Acidobacteriaceae bacterium]|nr:hypothetical protein [Acidobacteriaceae bacterium]